ncbi:MAG: phenylacetate--CoA ligase family protein [Gammaproteobacteria bacterium]|nr:phenylacetate--CoA ligase family protein [Gammaproteobacteria bacterium]
MRSSKEQKGQPVFRFPKGWHQETDSPLPKDAIVGKLEGLYRMEQSQWWSLEALRKHQLNQLQELLAHAWHTVPYYRSRLESLGYQPDLQLDDVLWRSLPLLKRADIHNAGDELMSTKIPIDHGGTSTFQTSGSTGEPVKGKGTSLTSAYWDVLTLRDHYWHKRDLSGVLASIRVFSDKKMLPPDGGRSSNWGKATKGLFRTGPAIGLDIMTSVAEQADWLARNNPEYILTYPSNLEALARYCMENTVKLPALREVRTLGEIVTGSLRELCREAWNVGLVDTYSSKEFGYIALQCPEHEHYHVQSESVLVEVLDGEGEPCKPGEIGRLVITSLYNYAMPLIRYEIGDLAEVGSPCSCGRGLPVIKRILGRTRNMLTLPNGEQRWPLVGFSKFREIAPVKQFQFVQTSLQEVLVRLVVERPLLAGEEDGLREIIRESLGHPFDIRFEYMDVIHRGKGGKYEEFISELG